MFTHEVSTLQSERRISLSLRISGEGEARGEVEGEVEVEARVEGELEGEVEGRVEGEVGEGMEMLMGRQVACTIMGSTIVQGMNCY